MGKSHTFVDDCSCVCACFRSDSEQKRKLRAGKWVQTRWTPATAALLSDFQADGPRRLARSTPLCLSRGLRRAEAELLLAFVPVILASCTSLPPTSPRSTAPFTPPLLLVRVRSRKAPLAQSKPLFIARCRVRCGCSQPPHADLVSKPLQGWHPPPPNSRWSAR